MRAQFSAKQDPERSPKQRPNKFRKKAPAPVYDVLPKTLEPQALDSQVLGEMASQVAPRKGISDFKSTVSAAKDSHHQSDASSNNNTLSKPERESLPTGLQNKSKDAIASDQTFVVRIDALTNTVKLNGDLRIFGTDNQDLTYALVEQVFGVVLNAAGKHDLQNLKYALATINGIGPKDELEGLLAVQMIGVHSLALECLKRASREDQTTYGMDVNINRATKLLRTFTAQMEALNRHRGKVGQQMVVGNVNVNEGGQAIVGPVRGGGDGKAFTEDNTAKVE